MAAITITDLNNAKTDVDHLAAIATSTALTVTDRLGHSKKTIAGLSAEFLNAGVYATAAAGLSATGNGQYFSALSSNLDDYLILYLNSSGSAVEQKKYPSATLVSLGIKSFKPSPNLFNYRTVLAGKINQANNYYGTNAAYGSSLRIPVLPGDVYYFTVGDVPIANTSSVYSFAVAPSLEDNPITVVTPINGTITIPSGNYYLSLSALIGLMIDPSLKWQLTKYTMPTKYYDAGYIIDPTYTGEYPLFASLEFLKPALDKLTSLPALEGLNEQQTEFLKIGNNTYQHIDWQWGYSVNTSTGGLNASGANWVTTNYISVTPNVVNFISMGLNRELNHYIEFTAYYDENKVFINQTVTVNIDSETGIKTFTPPGGARYIRTSKTTGTTEEAAADAFRTLMVSIGYAPFELYGYSSDESSSRFKDREVRSYLKPFLGKRAAFLGDSITIQALYFGKLCEATGIDYLLSNRTLGVNGQVMRTVADALTPELLTDVDVVTVWAGTNDYGHGNVTLEIPLIRKMRRHYMVLFTT